MTTPSRLLRALLGAVLPLCAVGLAQPASAATCSSTASVKLVSSTAPRGGTLTLTGTGWCHPSNGGSTIGVKLDDGAYSRTDSEISANRTIWATIQADTDGTFTTAITLPDGTSATSTPAYPDGTHTLRLLSGSLKAGDTPRTVQSDPFTVTAPGAAPSPDPVPTTTPTADPTPTTTTCTAASASVSLNRTTVSRGGTIDLTGTGWCHPTGGGSRIGVKLDDGAYSHLDGGVNANRSVWAVIDADADGTFAARITLPDGTSATSTPAFPDGSHTLRLLSGSLKSGDTIRTVESASFTVGAGSYRPTGIPDPVAPAELTTRVGASVAGTRLRVTVPGGTKGDWVFVSTLAADGSPRDPWGATWYQLDATGSVTITLGNPAISGRTRIVVQNGNDGHVGEALGYAVVDAPVGSTTTTSATTSQQGATAAVAGGAVAISSPAAAASSAALGAALGAATTATGLAVPAQPAAAYAALTTATKLPAALVGKVLSAKLPDTSGPVFVYVYDSTRIVPAGWIEPDSSHLVRADLRKLPSSEYRVTYQDRQGRLLGWAEADLRPAATSASTDAPPVAAALRPASAGTGWFSGTDAWLLALGGAVLVGVLTGRRGRSGVLR